MKKPTLLLLSTSVLVLALSTSAFAWDVGCTPGYWKQPQHFSSWVGYTPEKTLQEVFGCGGSTTLLQALNTNGGGLYALQRHAVAALLNSTAVQGFDFTTQQVKTKFCAALTNGETIESQKNKFEAKNDGTCALK